MAVTFASDRPGLTAEGAKNAEKAFGASPFGQAPIPLFTQLSTYPSSKFFSVPQWWIYGRRMTALSSILGASIWIGLFQSE